MHIDNLYKPEAQHILMFHECYALEKIHGSSAHISWKHETGLIHLFGGGESAVTFERLFDQPNLINRFRELFQFDDAVIFGEVYGGKQQGQSHKYGNQLKFVGFDVKVGKSWLNVPNADDVTQKMGLEFVAYERVKTDLDSLNFERDRDSRQAIRNGVGAGIKQEGVVLRPLLEMTLNDGSRIICKHKRDDYKETKTSREVSPEALQVLTEAKAIAEEWVTPHRLEHVLQKLPQDLSMKDVPKLMQAMKEDVYREGRGEIVESKEAEKAIGAKAVELFKKHLQAGIKA